MSDDAQSTFKIDDLLISVISAAPLAGIPAPPPTSAEIVSGTRYITVQVVTYAAAAWPGWPDNAALLCSHDGQGASLAPNAHDPGLLAGVKALLRAQIAHIKAQTPAALDAVLQPTTVAQAEALESSLAAALEKVRQIKADLGA